MSKLAIIGTAGRHEDGTRLNQDPKRYWRKMIDATTKVAELVGAKTLVSGGAAWADHCAVALFLSKSFSYKLELELPAPLVADKWDGLWFDPQYKDGKTSNWYHGKFKSAMTDVSMSIWSPFCDFRAAVSHPNCTTRVGDGFFDRNLKVSQADHVIAMTFGEGKKLKDGGTAHTMRAFLARKDHGEAYHLDLNTLRLWKGAAV